MGRYVSSQVLTAPTKEQLEFLRAEEVPQGADAAPMVRTFFCVHEWILSSLMRPVLPSKQHIRGTVSTVREFHWQLLLFPPQHSRHTKSLLFLASREAFDISNSIHTTAQKLPLESSKDSEFKDSTRMLQFRMFQDLTEISIKVFGDHSALFFQELQSGLGPP